MLKIAPSNFLFRAILPYTLRAVLRTFKFIPDEFVEPNDEQKPSGKINKKASPKIGEAFLFIWRAWKDSNLRPLGS